MNFPVGAEDLESLQLYLREKRWIAPAEELVFARDLSRGDAFRVVRVRSNFRSFIIKEETFSDHDSAGQPLPAGRIISEGRFYDLVQLNAEMRDFTPEISGMDLENHFIILEYFSDSETCFDRAQRGKTIKPGIVKKLIRFLSVLHNQFSVPPDLKLANTAMREMFASDLFGLEYEKWQASPERSADDPASVEMILADKEIQANLKALKMQYLAEGPHLIHGGFRPYAWLRTIEGVKVISPSYCAFNRAEFDLGTLIAHLHLIPMEEPVMKNLLGDYIEPEGFQMPVALQVAGAEMLRCLLFPVKSYRTITDEERTKLLEKAVALIKTQAS